MAFHFLEDFSQHNEKNHPYGINVEKVSVYSHNHGSILEDGFYHILMDGNLPLKEAHDTATAIEQKLKDRYGEETHVAIHVEPIEEVIP